MLPIIGIILIILGILLIVLSSSQVKVYWGVGGFLGPIPFGFANHPYILILTTFLTILVLLLYLLWMP